MREHDVRPSTLDKHPRLAELIALMRERYPEVVAQVAPDATGFEGYNGRRLLSPLSRKRLERILGYMLDENEFLGPFGIRSMSKHYEENPFTFSAGGTTQTVRYVAAESDTGMFGGNSNWRGPVWMPVNALIVRGLLNLYWFYGNDLKVECPTGSGVQMTLFEVAQEITRRLESIFVRDVRRRAAGLRRSREVPGRSPLARLHPVLRVLPWRQRRWLGCQSSDWLDRRHSALDGCFRAPVV